jgi:hypothetical protein
MVPCAGINENAQTSNMRNKRQRNFRADFKQLHLERAVARTHNSGFKKLAVQWLIEHSTSHQHLWWLDSFVLRNRQLLKPTKRYGSFLYEDLCERKALFLIKEIL